jgi:3-oxoacyl-[acyl-carrier protein] reductase
MEFSGKVALVTGGGRGIGKATALALARHGADVVVNYLQNSEAASRTVEMIQGLGRKTLAIAANVGKQPEVEKLFEAIDANFPRIDILINNAGTGALKPLEAISTEFWDHVLQVDLTGPFLCTQAAACRMIPNNYGRIVNISSIAGINGMDVDPTYTAAKAGLLGFTKSMARYLGKHNITVNSICPGPTDTELSRKEIPEAVRVRVARSSALGRMGTPEDVADAILFFASDYSRHVTGQTVVVDGGIVMP